MLLVIPEFIESRPFMVKLRQYRVDGRYARAAAEHSGDRSQSLNSDDEETQVSSADIRVGTLQETALTLEINGRVPELSRAAIIVKSVRRATAHVVTSELVINSGPTSAA
jgi:hypothetical protein